MDIQREIVVEEDRRRDEKSQGEVDDAGFDEPAFHTFLISASEMPRFSTDEINLQLGEAWSDDATGILRRLAAKSKG